MTSHPLKVYALFGDYGRYSGQTAESPHFRIDYSPYLFEAYFSFLDMDKGRMVVDKELLEKLVCDIYAKNYDMVYSGDSAEALLLQYVIKRQGMKPKCFLINDPDLFVKAKRVADLIRRYYHEEFFDEFLFSPLNHWFVTARFRGESYLNMGMRESNLHYIPLSLAAIGMFFPAMAGWLNQHGPATAGEKVVSAGSHDRDYPLLVNAVRGLDVRIDIICNLDAYRTVPSHNVCWRHSMPEEDYLHALASARYLVLPLKYGGRVAGQLNCVIGMCLGKIIIAPECAALEEYLEDGKTGVLYRQGDWQNLKEKIAFVEEKFSEIKFIGEGAKEYEKKLSRIAEKNLKSLADNLRQRVENAR